METPTIATFGKFLINTIFPFFKESKALQLIKNDTIEVSDDLIAKLYDTTKKWFVVDDRKSVVQQLEELRNKPNDKILQVGTGAIIAEYLNEKGDFYKQIETVINEIEKKYQHKVSEIITELNLKGIENDLDINSNNELENGAKIKTKAEINGDRNKITINKNNKMK